MKRSPARLVIALSVAAALAVFILYTSIAGAGTPQIAPSTLSQHDGEDVLLVARARRDLSFVYVAQHTSRSLPLGYALSAFWGGQEGSLLLWLLVLTGYSALAVWLNRRSR